MGGRVQPVLQISPPLLQMNQCGCEFPQMIQRAAERLMRRQEQHWIVVLLSQTQKLIGQFAGRLARALTQVEVPEPPNCRKQMGRFADFSAQLQRPGVRRRRLGSSVTLCGDERFAQSNLKLEFLSGRVQGIGERARDLVTDVRSPPDWLSARSPSPRLGASTPPPGHAGPPPCSAGQAIRAER
jgi:hypothetical protein